MHIDSIDYKMNREEFISQQNFRLKNQISDLRNALVMNRDFLTLLSKQQTHAESKIDLLYKIIIRLTEQSDLALLNNLELIQEKDVLKQQNLKLNMHLDSVEARLEAQLEKNRINDHPSQAKFAIQQQLTSLTKEILAAREENIELEEELRHWKQKCANIEAYLRDMTQPEEPLPINISQTVDKHQSFSPKRRKISRKYISCLKLKQQEKSSDIQKEIRQLKRYIQQLQNRLSVFIKAYNFEEEVLQHKSSKLVGLHPLDQQRDLQIRLLKYAMNQIKFVQKDEEKYMVIRHNFRDSEDKGLYRANRKKQSTSWPKYKEFKLEAETQDDDLYDLISSNKGKAKKC